MQPRDQRYFCVQTQRSVLSWFSK